MNRLVLLHTNDLHSQFENMPKLASRIRAYRSKYPADELLVIDCGDHMDRVSAITEGSCGEANVAVMNATGYDVFVPGNNEGLTFAKSSFETMFKGKTDFTVLGTNMRDWKTGATPPWMAQELIVDKGGRKIGLIGVTASFNDFYHPLGWDVGDPLTDVQKAVEALRAQADVIVVISHVGIRFDRLLADKVPVIDCILGGHTHHLFEQAEHIGDTCIGAAGKLGSHLGVVEMEFTPGTRRPTAVRGRAESVEQEVDDPQIASIIQTYRASSQHRLSQQAALLEEPLDHDPLQESDLGNLLAEGLRAWTDAEVGIVNSGQLLHGLAAGSCSEGDILEVCPSPVNPCSLLLTGSQLMQALEESLVEEIIRRRIHGFGFRGYILGTLSVSGMDIVYDAHAADHQKIISVQIQGKRMELDRLYRVGTIDMFTFGVGYPSLGQGREIHFYLPELLRDILKRELANPQAVRACRRRNFRAT